MCRSDNPGEVHLITLLIRFAQLRHTRHHPQLSRLPFLQHLPRLLCYDVAHVHTGPVQEKEATGWTLWRWWIRRLRSCASGVA